MLNDNNDNIEPNTEEEGIDRIDDKAVGKQKPKKGKQDMGFNKEYERCTTGTYK
mgnify:CR=1 FL=1